MNAGEPIFWIMIASIVIAVSFVVMAIALVAIAIVVKRVIATVSRVEEKIDPLLTQVNAMSVQGKEISVQFTEISNNLATATKYFSESAALVKDEVREIKQLVGETAIVAKDKVALVSQTIDQTQHKVVTTTDFINTKIVEPARELAAVMAGVRKGLEVLFAPAPKQIDRVYTEDEMFIG